MKSGDKPGLLVTGQIRVSQSIGLAACPRACPVDPCTPALTQYVPLSERLLIPLTVFKVSHIVVPFLLQRSDV
jgi:hypothetical protein